MDINNYNSAVPEDFPNPYDSKYWYREGDIYRFTITMFTEDIDSWFILEKFRQYVMSNPHHEDDVLSSTWNEKFEELS